MTKEKTMTKISVTKENLRTHFQYKEISLGEIIEFLEENGVEFEPLPLKPTPNGIYRRFDNKDLISLNMAAPGGWQNVSQPSRGIRWAYPNYPESGVWVQIVDAGGNPVSEDKAFIFTMDQMGRRTA